MNRPSESRRDSVPKPRVGPLRGPTLGSVPDPRSNPERVVAILGSPSGRNPDGVVENLDRIPQGSPAEAELPWASQRNAFGVEPLRLADPSARRCGRTAFPENSPPQCPTV